MRKIPECSEIGEKMLHTGTNFWLASNISIMVHCVLQMVSHCDLERVCHLTSVSNPCISSMPLHVTEVQLLQVYQETPSHGGLFTTSSFQYTNTEEES